MIRQRTSRHALLLAIALVTSSILPPRPPSLAAPARQPTPRPPAAQQATIAQPIGTLAELRSALLAAEQDLVTGNVQASTLRLFSVLESGKFQPFTTDPEYQNAELTLARALVKAGAFGAAQVYLARVLRRGSGQPFFVVAYRAMVDIGLETREEAAILSRLDALAASATLPKDSANERAYLAGKTKYGIGRYADATRAFSAIDRQSRFFASGLYFRGLIEARDRRFSSARAHFCEIVGQVDNSRFTFFVDGRYWAIKDLAFLALGRVAHEQGRHDDAYYFYFRVPEDAEKLPDALLEAAWSMFQKGEYQAAQAFIQQFQRAFPTSPLGPDALLLQAMIDLKSCRFDAVRATLQLLVKTYAPIQAEVARLVAQPERRRLLYQRMLGGERLGRERDRILDLLRLDPRFHRHVGYLTSLDREASLLPEQIAVWDQLAAKRDGQPASGQAADPQAKEAAQLLADARELAHGTRDTPELRDAAAALVAASAEASRSMSAPGAGTKEAHLLHVLSGQTAQVRARLVDATSALAEDALIDLDRRLQTLLRQARLTHIDAVIGKKKRLENEIANLSEGRYPTEMLGRLETEGLIQDDEEYWPYEGEYWADEYENFR